MYLYMYFQCAHMGIYPHRYYPNAFALMCTHTQIYVYSRTYTLRCIEPHVHKYPLTCTCTHSVCTHTHIHHTHLLPACAHTSMHILPTHMHSGMNIPTDAQTNIYFQCVPM